MLLKTKKKIAGVVAAFTLAASLGYGGGKLATAISQDIAASRARDAAALKALAVNDTRNLLSEGYIVRQQFSAGHDCVQSGTTDDAGYVGPGTAAAYIADSNGRTGKICVYHSATGTEFMHAKFKRMVTPGLDQNGTLSQLMETDTAEFRDRDTLAARGFRLNGVLQQAGSACESEGVTNNDGYHGARTSLAYNASYNDGRTGQVCADHNAEGILTHAQFSQDLRF